MQVGDIPYTLNGKRVEVPVKKVGVSFLLTPDQLQPYPTLGLTGSLRSRHLKTHPPLNLDLEWGSVGFIQHGYSSEP